LKFALVIARGFSTLTEEDEGRLEVSRKSRRQREEKFGG